jgi:hypothetical protein
MKKMAIIGNCQAESLTNFLFSNNNFKNIYEYIEVKPIYLMNENELNYFYTYTLIELDLIIIQPINEDFNGNIKYSTKTILNNTKNDCISILIPSLYFDFYHPYLCYLNGEHGKIQDPIDYHDKILIKLYLANKELSNEVIIEKYMNIFNNEIFINNSMCNDNLKLALDNIEDRENNFKDYIVNNTKCIYSYDFIKNNYQQKLLFYSVNHPSKYLLSYLSDEILKYLKIRSEDYPNNLDPFNILIIPIYNCLKNVLNFDITQYNNMCNDNELYNKYIDIYRTIPDNILSKNIIYTRSF